MDVAYGGEGNVHFCYDEEKFPLTIEEDQITGLDLQADDYITIPFSMPVLLRKISAIWGRSSGTKISGSLNYRDLTLDVDNYRAYVRLYRNHKRSWMLNG